MADPLKNPAQRLAVVYNPTKIDLDDLKPQVQDAAETAGWEETLWFPTSADDGGVQATRQAVEAGASVVLAAGGDGTVRAVVEGLRNTDVGLALLPSGTGNLLARNLDMKLTDVQGAVELAFTGADRRIDVGIAEVTDGDGTQTEHVFLVMAGLGLDAKMIANTSTRLKKAVGWLAYIDGGVRALPGLKPVRLRYALDRGPMRSMSAHTLIIGNCGYLPGGILLLPEAAVDNGRLEVCALRPRGMFGWLKIWRIITWENGVLRRSAVGRKIIDLRNDVKSVTYFETTKMRVIVNSPQDFQVDGDPVGQVVAVHARVEPGSLTVKVPRATAATGAETGAR